MATTFHDELHDTVHSLPISTTTRPRYTPSRSLFAAPCQLNAELEPSSRLTRQALSQSSALFDTVQLSAGGKPWWDCSAVASASTSKLDDNLKTAIVHIEHTQFGSATSVNSLGLEAVAIPDWTRTRTTSVADSLDDESALPGAFDAGAAEDSAWASALGLQFDEDLEMGDAFAPFAGLPSPVQAPTSAPPPSPVALVLERLSLLPRKRSASNTAGPLPTPPLSQGGDEEERPSWSSPATPRKSLRKNSIPLPSLFDDLPTTPVSLPPTLTRFTSALQSAIERRESSRVSLSPPPLLAPTPLPTTSTFDLYGHTLHFTGLSRPQGRLLPSDDTAAYVREQRCVAECVGEESSTRGRQGRMGEYFVKCMVRQEAFEREGEVDALSVLCLELQRESRHPDRHSRAQQQLQQALDLSPAGSDSTIDQLRSPPTPAFIPIPCPPGKRRRKL